VTRLVMTPTLLHATLLEAENFPENPWTSLRFLTSSGELLTRKLLEKLQKTLPKDCSVLNLYGSTEVAADATYAELPRDDVAIEHPLVPCGRAIPNVWLEIRGEEGDYAECTAGEEGEVFIFGACLSSGGF
jgi:non-ribosomal peptide synthetase component F